MTKHSNPVVEVGERIRRAREHRGLTQRMLGRMLGVSFQMVQAYERGAKISLERLYDIALCLAVDADWLFTGHGYSPDDDLMAIMPGRLGFYGRPANSRVVFDVDTHTKAACGAPPDAPSQLAWQGWYDRIHSDDRARVDAELERLNDPRDGICSVRYRLLGVDGVERCIIDYGHMTFDGNGQAIRLQGLMLDITREPRIQKTEDKIERVLLAAHRRWRRRRVAQHYCPQFVPGGLGDLPLPC